MVGPTPAAIRWLYNEARSFVAMQATAIDVLDDKAVEVLRFNALFLGLVIAGVSFIQGSEAGTWTVPVWAVSCFAAGLAMIIGSTWTATSAFMRRRFYVGLSPTVLEPALAHDVDEEDLMVEALGSYRVASEHNRGAIGRAAQRLGQAMQLLQGGVAVIATVSIALMADRAMGG